MKDRKNLNTKNEAVNVEKNKMLSNENNANIDSSNTDKSSIDDSIKDNQNADCVSEVNSNIDDINEDDSNMKDLKDKGQFSRFKEIIKILVSHKIIYGITPEKLRLILEDLGPVYIKLGQIVSMRSDLLPDDYLEELCKLRSDVRPEDFNSIKSIIEDEYDSKINEIFDDFQKDVVGSASIAQTHKARIYENQDVIVKVQREGIMKKAESDIKLMKKASKILKIAASTENVVDFNMLLNELWETTKQEMDFVFEAENMKKFHELNKNESGIYCPSVINELSNSKILVMEYIEGISLEEMDKLKESGCDTRQLGKRLAKNYFKQVIEDGYFHADPHPGNIIIKGNDIVWIDLGMMGTISNRDRKLIKKMVVAIVNNNITELKDLIIVFGNPSRKIDHIALYDDIEQMVQKYIEMDLASINLPEAMKELLQLAKKHGISMPSGITMLARGIATIEGVVEMLSPDINMMEILKDEISKKVYNEINYKEEIQKIARLIMNNSKKTIQFPAILSDFINSLYKGRNKINFEISSSYAFEQILKKIFDKLFIGIIIMGCLIASGIMSLANRGKIANVLLIISLVLFVIQMLKSIFDKNK